jgi:hypothetical protein
MRKITVLCKAASNSSREVGENLLPPQDTDIHPPGGLIAKRTPSTLKDDIEAQENRAGDEGRFRSTEGRVPSTKK